MDKRESYRMKSDLMIFVGGLESSTTNHELLQHFGCFGVIRFCQVQCWKNNPAKCRGFALMDIADRSTFENILLTPHRLNGRPIEVKKMILDKEELEEHTTDLNKRKLFVSNLPKKLTDIELTEFFRQFGNVELAYIIKHHKDNKSKGFGFVLYRNQKDKESVLRQVQQDGITIQGKKVVCISYVAKKSKNSENISSESSIPMDNFRQQTGGGSDPLPVRPKNDNLETNSQKRKEYSLGRVETPNHYLKLNIRKIGQNMNLGINSFMSTNMGDGFHNSSYEGGTKLSVHEQGYFYGSSPTAMPHRPPHHNHSYSGPKGHKAIGSGKMPLQARLF